MEVIWQGESGDSAESGFRLVINDDGLLMFQRRSADSPEWSGVDDPDDEPTPRDFLLGGKPG